MSTKARQAVYAKFNTNSDLVNATYQSDADIKCGLYFNQVPEDTNVLTPYVVYNLRATMQENEFCDSFDNTFLEFLVYDKTSATNVDNIVALLNTTYNRQTLTYSDATHIGCIRQSEPGVLKLQDCWFGKIDFLLTYNG